MCKLVHSRRSTTRSQQSHLISVLAHQHRQNPRKTTCPRARVPCRASNGDADPALAAPNSDGPSEPTSLPRPSRRGRRPDARVYNAGPMAMNRSASAPPPRPRHSPALPRGSAQQPRFALRRQAVGSRLGLPGRQMVRGLELSMGGPAGAGRQGGGYWLSADLI